MTPPPKPRNDRPPQTWENAGICPKCEAGDYWAYNRHDIRWQKPDTLSDTGRGWLEASCWRCGFQWQIKAADEE